VHNDILHQAAARTSHSDETHKNVAGTGTELLRVSASEATQSTGTLQGMLLNLDAEEKAALLRAGYHLPQVSTCASGYPAPEPQRPAKTYGAQQSEGNNFKEDMLELVCAGKPFRFPYCPESPMAGELAGYVGLVAPNIPPQQMPLLGCCLQSFLLSDYLWLRGAQHPETGLFRACCRVNLGKKPHEELSRQEEEAVNRHLATVQRVALKNLRLIHNELGVDASRQTVFRGLCFSSEAALHSCMETSLPEIGKHPESYTKNLGVALGFATPGDTYKSGLAFKLANSGYAEHVKKEVGLLYILDGFAYASLECFPCVSNTEGEVWIKGQGARSIFTSSSTTEILQFLEKPLPRSQRALGPKQRRHIEAMLKDMARKSKAFYVSVLAPAETWKSEKSEQGDKDRRAISNEGSLHCQNARPDSRPETSTDQCSEKDAMTDGDQTSCGRHRAPKPSTGRIPTPRTLISKVNRKPAAGAASEREAEPGEDTAAGKETADFVQSGAGVAGSVPQEKGGEAEEWHTALAIECAEPSLAELWTVAEKWSADVAKTGSQPCKFRSLVGGKKKTERLPCFLCPCQGYADKKQNQPKCKVRVRAVHDEGLIKVQVRGKHRCSGSEDVSPTDKEKMDEGVVPVEVPCSSSSGAKDAVPAQSVRIDGGDSATNTAESTGWANCMQLTISRHKAIYAL